MSDIKNITGVNGLKNPNWFTMYNLASELRQSMMDQRREEGLPINHSTRVWLNARLRAVEHPNTFEVPSSKEISALRVGDYVKIAYEVYGKDHQVRGERFWVQLTHNGSKEAFRIKNGAVLFFGTVANDLEVVNELIKEHEGFELMYGDMVSLTSDNILEVVETE